MEKGYREACSGCTERDATVATLRAEVVAAKKAAGPRWVVDISDDHAGWLAALWFSLTVSTAVWWIFAGGSPAVLRAWCVVAVLTVAVAVLVTRQRVGAAREVR